mmetsp:Transcript_21549/g.28061  ORF Transcript_21549/g.28061 Transcript_21549/m.28061 type:complete len:271 (-) Transcript_21549:188-1000(-)
MFPLRPFFLEYYFSPQTFLFPQNFISCLTWDCPSCDGNMEVTSIYNSTTDGNGFVGYTNDTNTIVISFAGTNPLSIQDWIDDIDFIQTDFNGYGNINVDDCTDCEVHKGFYETYMSIADQVHNALDYYLSVHSDADIVVTGHSLGAAIAQHCAMDLTISDFNVKSLYNFGQPRTGNKQFSQYATKIMNNKIMRITHHKDPVPHLPLEAMGFYHEPTEIFYNELNNDYTICNSSDGEDSSCSDKYYEDLNLLDHLSYMNIDFLAAVTVCIL